MNEPKNLIVGICGASGVIYGVRLLQMLREIGGFHVHLVMSSTAKLNLRIETDWALEAVEALADQVHDCRDLTAVIASGSYRSAGMIVAPCSIKTLAAIATSNADTLLSRAADVVLKERRRLVLMLRETPLHAGHCKLLWDVSNIGAIVAPPVPAFYNRPATLDEVITHSVGRVLDLFDIDYRKLQRWHGYPAG